MFNWFKKKSKTTEAQDQQFDEAQYMQAVVNKFVTVLDAHMEAFPETPEFRDRWTFELKDVSSYMHNENTGRMSCRIIAKDLKNEYPDFSEWAHGFGESIDAAFDLGFTNWIATDLPVLIDVIQEKSVLSTEVSFEQESTGKNIRGILGPMQFWLQGDEGPQPCCNTCIFSQAMLTTDGALKDMTVPYLIKAVVARNPDNTTTSDFRINGEQNEEIASALSKWAESWEGDGFTMRKQSLLFVEAS